MSFRVCEGSLKSFFGVSGGSGLKGLGVGHGSRALGGLRISGFVCGLDWFGWSLGFVGS